MAITTADSRDAGHQRQKRRGRDSTVSDSIRLTACVVASDMRSAFNSSTFFVLDVNGGKIC